MALVAVVGIATRVASRAATTALATALAARVAPSVTTALAPTIAARVAPSVATALAPTIATPVALDAAVTAARRTARFIRPAACRYVTRARTSASMQLEAARQIQHLLHLSGLSGLLSPVKQSPEPPMSAASLCVSPGTMPRPSYSASPPSRDSGYDSAASIYAYMMPPPG